MPHDPPHAPTAAPRWRPTLDPVMRRLYEKHPAAQAYAGCACHGIGVAVIHRSQVSGLHYLVDDAELVGLASATLRAELEQGLPEFKNYQGPDAVMVLTHRC